MSSKIAISIKNINLTLGNKVILDNVSVDLNCGELTVLLGPNGTGKSSLLKVITQEWPCSGEVSFFDQPYHQWDAAELAKHLGVLPQASSLTFNFTVEEVVELGALALSESQQQINNIAQDNMAKTDILNLAQRLYPSLSGGEKQRVHLARVLTQLAQSGNQTALLLDEPTSSLDLSHQHQTLSLAKSLAQAGACVIAVIHDLNLAAQYADRVLMLNGGKIVADGTPWQTLTAETIEGVYQWPVQIVEHPKRDCPVILS